MTHSSASSPSAPLDVRVLELLVSRLCHDMVSPIGAVNNGIELIEELGEGMEEQAVELIAQSGRRAASRLQCFRLAYGAAGAQAPMAPAEVRPVAEGWLGDKVTMDWRVAPADVPASPPAGAAKVLLNAVMLADEALTYGGTVAVTPAEGGAAGLAVTASGRSAALGDERRDALDGAVPVEALTPRTVHAYVTGLFARHYGLDLAFDQPAGDRLVLRLAL
ncbi:MAG TPA: histidine phosphotransferase family protein [Alphaproteobacteria bacterium]|nr:histidine phosphotransferase family protein [Alphaproteobacteria bacterium]